MLGLLLLLLRLLLFFYPYTRTFFSLLWERDRDRDRQTDRQTDRLMWEKNIYCLPSWMCPVWAKSVTWVCALTGNWTCVLWSMGRCSNNWATPARAVGIIKLTFSRWFLRLSKNRLARYHQSPEASTSYLHMSFRNSAADSTGLSQNEPPSPSSIPLSLANVHPFRTAYVFLLLFDV